MHEAGQRLLLVGEDLERPVQAGNHEDIADPAFFMEDQLGKTAEAADATSDTTRKTSTRTHTSHIDG